jgi:hypothetical protein
MTKPAKNGLGYETRDVAPRAVVASGVSLLCGTVFCGLLVVGLLELLPVPARHGKPPLETALQEPPAPRLEIDGRSERAAVETAAAAKLVGYAWVDRAAGAVRIPIERAMELTAQQGWGRP